MIGRFIAALFAGIFITSVQADPAPIRAAIVACVKVNDDGVVTDAFILKSSGDPTIDEGMLSVIKSHHWDSGSAGGAQNGWHPQRMTMKGETPYAMPETCGPENKN